MSIKQELLERYNATGKIGFVKPINDNEAYKMIETIADMYNEEPEEIVLTLDDIATRMKTFFDKF